MAVTRMLRTGRVCSALILSDPRHCFTDVYQKFTTKRKPFLHATTMIRTCCQRQIKYVCCGRASFMLSTLACRSSRLSGRLFQERTYTYHHGRRGGSRLLILFCFRDIGIISIRKTSKYYGSTTASHHRDAREMLHIASQA